VAAGVWRIARTPSGAPLRQRRHHDEQLADILGDEHVGALWRCVFEDLLARDLDDGRNIVDDYLKRRGWKESASSRAYMLALRSSVVSLYEVSEIVPDECFLARDLVRRGELIRIMERRATHDLKPWDRIVARIVTLGTRTEMTGGVLRLDREASEAALKAFRRVSQAARKQAGRFARELGRPQANSLLAEILPDTEILRGSAFLFTNIWLDDMLTRALNPTLPQICNTDGDELVITKVSYPLKTAASAGAVRCALAAIPGLRAESNTLWRWIAPQKQPASPGSSSHTIITTVEDGSLLLGTLGLKHDKLVLEANSRKRAERGRALIAPGYRWPCWRASHRGCNGGRIDRITAQQNLSTVVIWSRAGRGARCHSRQPRPALREPA
jgi:hypothetical protein